MPFCSNCGSGHSGREPNCATCGAAVEPLAPLDALIPVPVPSVEAKTVTTPVFRPSDRYFVAIGVPAQAAFAAWYYATTNRVSFAPAFAGYLILVASMWWAVGALAKAKRRRAVPWWIFTICFGPFPLIVLLFMPRVRTE